MSCPACGTPLENYNNQEGGWCPQCEEWWPADIVKERMEENEPYEPDDEERMAWEEEEEIYRREEEERLKWEEGQPDEDEEDEWI